MAGSANSGTIGTSQLQSVAYERFAGVCAILAGVVGFLYSVSFVFLKNELLSTVCLLAGGLLATAALVAAYGRVRWIDSSFALLAVILGMVGALGSAIHGAYDLANVINPPAATGPDLPNPVDPRGLLTFGVAGLALFSFAWLITRGRALPRGLGYLGFVLAVLLVLIYLGRLIVFDAQSPLILVPAALAGFLVNPAWYIWLGTALIGGRGG